MRDAEHARNERERPPCKRQLVEIPLVVRTFTRFDRQELARSVSHHYDLVEAIDGRNADWAVAVMRAHIHAGRQVMLRTSAGGDDEFSSK